MAQPAPTVAGRFTIDFDHALPGAAGAQQAFAARAVRGDVAWMAVQAEWGWPVRALELAALADQDVANVLLPAAHGPASLPGGGTGYFVVCPAPPGPSLTADARPWLEAPLLDCVLRPVAAALHALQVLKVTHRAINPGNLFQARPGGPVMLGSAWAAPPACQQPALFEPPYSAACLPAGRGQGSIADDVYALGVLIATLALGADPTRTTIRRRSSAASWIWAVTLPSSAPAACRPASRSWSGAWWRTTPTIVHRRPCCAIRPRPGRAG